jgi:hypothetical protein
MPKEKGEHELVIPALRVQPNSHDELNAEVGLWIAIAFFCFARKRRGPYEPDVGEPRREDFLHNEAPVTIVFFGIFARLGIPQHENAAGL